ncbi:MAG: substrate-binding domain-containing protein, partial [Planctomycetota bacterium]|nr:substrate-binding domain-containing protein [Planctomycetota bacterium]
VSLTTAQRAMKLLSEQGLIVRRSKSGTFIGQAVGSEQDSKVRVIHFLSPPEYREYACARMGPTLKGLDRILPEVSVQFSVLPANQPEKYLANLLSTSRLENELVGVLAASCPIAVYEHLAKLGVPTVVSGSLPVSGPKLPSIDFDHREAGRLLTEYLLRRGHRRIALLARTLDRPGDRLWFNGVSQALTDAQLPHNALTLEIVPYRLDLIATTMSHLRSMDDPPTGFLARTEALASLLGKASESLGLSVPGDVEIVFADWTTAQVEQSPYSHVQTRYSREEASAKVGEMFQRIWQGKQLEQETMVVPVELCESEGQ